MKAAAPLACVLPGHADADSTPCPLQYDVTPTRSQGGEPRVGFELQATADYTQRAVEADEFGDKGLAVQLEDMVRDESGHSEETERILRDWPL